jgi:hypothetical protein
MKKVVLSAIVLLGASYAMRAQSIAPDVIATAGDYYSNANGSISWTMGETMGETYGNSNNIVSQGFQQPWDLFTSVPVADPVNVGLYPNPATDFVTLEFGTDAAGTYTVEVFNALGQQMSSQQVAANGATRFEIPMTGYADGIYFVSVKKIGSDAVSTFKVNKIS